MDKYRIILTSLTFLWVSGALANFEYPQGSGLYYDLSDGAAYLQWVDNAVTKGDITLPNQVVYDQQSYEVTGWGEYANFYQGGITSFVGSDGLTRIGTSAFYEATQLKTVTIGAACRTVGDYAFCHCSSLTTVTFKGDAPTFEGGQVFTNCPSLMSIKVPQGKVDAYVTALNNAGLQAVVGFVTDSEPTEELVYLQDGVIRWRANNEEVRLFGASYTLPSGCDYRAAGYVGGDRTAMIQEDLDHFRRMGFDALRLCFWGDFENSDRDGNLVENDHLDLLCRLIAEATQRDIYMLLSPIVTYDSRWPENGYDGYVDDGLQGMARHYDKWELIFDDRVKAASQNYLQQLLRYKNPYTGRQLKDEPNILFIELINEPTQHPDRPDEMKATINALVKAVRNTGCQKLLFYNYSQDYHVANILNESDIDGCTSAWYPLGLNSLSTLDVNTLLWVDSYEALHNPALDRLGKIVYEFNNTYQTVGYPIPAMVREFRKGGVQMAMVYAYDMLRMAPYNDTHYFNMVFTPDRAVGAMIGAEAMKQIARGANFGSYPDNTTFGDISLYPDKKLGLLNSTTKFYYTNDTEATPRDLSQLLHIAGHGSSPSVQYDGNGIYFLDKTDDRTWTLEVYPDIEADAYPYGSWSSLQDITNPQVVCKPVCRERTFVFKLPSLQGTYHLTPGIYTFTNGQLTASSYLPAKDFYESFTSVEIPTTTDSYNHSATSITLTTGSDRWSRATATRNFHCPTSNLSFEWADNRTQYRYVVDDLSPNADYDAYGYPCDATLSVYIGDRLGDQFQPETVMIRAKGLNNTDRVYCIFVDSDGRAFGTTITLSSTLSDITFPVSDLQPMRAAMLPQDWPGVNPYWYPASVTNTSATIDWSKVDFVQLSMRPELYTNLKERGFQLASITVTGNTFSTAVRQPRQDDSSVQTVYNLSGQRMVSVSSLAKGIYISEGQKFVVR